MLNLEKNILEVFKIEIREEIKIFKYINEI